MGGGRAAAGVITVRVRLVCHGPSQAKCPSVHSAVVPVRVRFPHAIQSGTPSFKFGFAKTATTMDTNVYHYDLKLTFWDFESH